MSRIITISREYGAGGHSIGRAVAEQLGIPFFDRDIVKETALQSGFDPDLVQKEEEDVTKADSIMKGIASFTSRYFHDSQDAIHEIQKAIILRLAEKEDCVILGRCADYILKEAGMDSLNVFIHADDLHRAVRVSELTGCKNATELQKLMAKKDASRHNYYNHYTGQHWGDSRNYDLSLDSGKLGYDLCIKLIVEAAKAKEGE